MPYLFKEQPILLFRSARADCPDCRAPLKVKKTQTKTVHTLTLGCFSAQETLLQCDRCDNPTIYAAEALKRLVPAGSTFGYEVVMSSLDSISEIVLGKVKVPGEKTQEIIPFLEEIRRRYGVPLAVVHDMGAGILAAVKEVFPGVPDFICHFHFLRDLGKDLLEADYDAIRKRLRQHALTEKLLYLARKLKTAVDQQPGLIASFCQSVQAGILPAEQVQAFPLLDAYSLIQWVLESKTQGHGYGFPFARPQVEFAKRLLVAAKELELIKDIHLRGQWKDNIPLCKLSHALKKVAADTGLQKMIAAIDVKIEVFDQLRGARRIAEVGGSAGLNSGSDLLPIGPIQKAVQRFRQRILARPDYPSASHWKALIAQMENIGTNSLPIRSPFKLPTEGCGFNPNGQTTSWSVSSAISDAALAEKAATIPSAHFFNP